MEVQRKTLEFKEKIEKDKDSKLNLREIVREIYKTSKENKEPYYRLLIEKRDLILTRSIRNECMFSKKIVVVVGMAHLDGIQDNWLCYQEKLLQLENDFPFTLSYFWNQFKNKLK